MGGFYTHRKKQILQQKTEYSTTEQTKMFAIYTVYDCKMKLNKIIIDFVEVIIAAFSSRNHTKTAIVSITAIHFWFKVQTSLDIFLQFTQHTSVSKCRLVLAHFYTSHNILLCQSVHRSSPIVQTRCAVTHVTFIRVEIKSNLFDIRKGKKMQFYIRVKQRMENLLTIGVYKHFFVTCIFIDY